MAIRFVEVPIVLFLECAVYTIEEESLATNCGVEKGPIGDTCSIGDNVEPKNFCHDRRAGGL